MKPEEGVRRSSRTCVTQACKSMYLELPDEDLFTDEEFYQEENEGEDGDDDESQDEVSDDENGEKEDDHETENGEDECDEEEEESANGSQPRRLLRKRSINRSVIKAEKERIKRKRISLILKKGEELRSEEDKAFLKSNAKSVKDIKNKVKLRERTANRKLEIEDGIDLQIQKCQSLAEAISKAKNLVVYTGAGISTAADIPDYRGPNGIWTLLDQGKTLDDKSFHKDLALARPTYTHMALFTLYKRGKLKHIVSQNCDGLHLRSGIPRYALSELHGNMFVELCRRCKPMRPFVRLFDVTEKTSKNRHTTMRRCHVCGTSLIDSIVHFGERGSLKWPLNWDGASKAAEKADVILCLGSSLKVLRRYPWLWCMDRPKNQRPDLYIINLQWTPKDSAATMKINGRCDEIMRQVMEALELEVPEYVTDNDPLLSYHTKLHHMEEHTCSRKPINFIKQEEELKTEPEECSDTQYCDFNQIWKLDHDYCQIVKKDPETSGEYSKEDLKPFIKEAEYSLRKRPPKDYSKIVKNGFVKASKKLDFKTIAWPRDALYIPYTFEDKFEYIHELEKSGQLAFYCDCCDPSRKRKRKSRRNSSSSESGTLGSSSSSSGDSDSSDDETSNKTSARNTDDEGSTCSKSKSEDSTSLNSVKNGSSCSNTTAPPGWFGKGRRSKRYRN